jgi:GcrA cell cycle regulator
MALHTKTSDRAVTEFHEILGTLGIAQHRVAKWFGVGPRSVRRWRDGTRHVPRAVDIVCNLLIMKVVTIEQVERAAAAIPAPAKTSGVKPERPVVEPMSAQAVLARTEAATLVDPGSTTVAAVLALREASCRWPIGDPKDCAFRFCNVPASAGSPYCAQHTRSAHLPQPLPKAHPAVIYGFRPGRRLLSSSGIEAPRRGDQDGARILTPAGAN